MDVYILCDKIRKHNNNVYASHISESLLFEHDSKKKLSFAHACLKFCNEFLKPK